MAHKDLREGQLLIEGLDRAPGSLPVWSAESSRHASGWHFLSADLGMKNGRPFGTVRFERLDPSHRVGLSVSWDHVYDQLRCFDFEGECDAADRERLERDVRHRVGTWMAIISEIGSYVASSPATQEAIFEAAHLAPERSARGQS